MPRIGRSPQTESPEGLLTEIVLARSRRHLGRTYLEATPQPGSNLYFEGQYYTILERHHHYQYQGGGYALQKMSVYVQATGDLTERNYDRDRGWVVGDPNCRYNARSPVLRCAVNPEGPCAGCPYFEAIA